MSLLVCVCCAAPSDNWQPNMNVNINTGSTHLSLSRWNRWHRPCLQCKHYKTFFKRNESKGFFSSSVLVYFFRHHLSIKYAIERRNKKCDIMYSFCLIHFTIQMMNSRLFKIGHSDVNSEVYRIQVAKTVTKPTTYINILWSRSYHSHYLSPPLFT